MQDIAKILIVLGVIILALGLWVLLTGKWPAWPRLPGDILIKKENWSFYFPIVTCLLVSIVINVILWLWRR